MKEVLEKFLNKEIKIEPFYYGNYILIKVSDNYFAVKSNSGYIKYIPYTSILDITESSLAITITLIGFKVDDFLDDLKEKIHRY